MSEELLQKRRNLQAPMPAARLRSRWSSQNFVIFDFTSCAAPTTPFNSDSKFWVVNSWHYEIYMSEYNEKYDSLVSSAVAALEELKKFENQSSSYP